MVRRPTVARNFPCVTEVVQACAHAVPCGVDNRAQTGREFTRRPFLNRTLFKRRHGFSTVCQLI